MSSGLISEPGKETKSSPGKARRLWLRRAGLAILILIGVGVVALAVLISLPGPDLQAASQGVEIFDRHDNEIVLLRPDRMIVTVPLSHISKYLPEAIVAAEDKNFYQHHGVDPLGILRALVADAEQRKFIQGGSTITQQLAKNLYFADQKRTLALKLNEALMALKIDRQYSKEQILESYLNNVYFGSGTYGAEQAAQRYFGKSAKSLSLGEAVYLAGLVNAPSKLSVNTEDAVNRQRAILDNMARFGTITSLEADEAKNSKLVVRDSPTKIERCAYYLNYLQKILEQQFDSTQLYQSNFKVYTYLDTTAQTLATKAITAGIRGAPKGVSQGALVSISVADGGVIALVGGAGSFLKSPWNRAISPHTAGSAFKPFVYLAGLITGVVKPDTMIDDAPLAVQIPDSRQTYAPRNFDGRYLGPITVRKALALSRNTCAVRVGQEVGPNKIVEVAHEAGITSKLEPTLALSLGASAVSPLDIADAYATLARDGVHIQPQFIKKVTNANGKIVREYQPSPAKVFDEEPVAELVDALQDVVQKGTAKQARLFGRPVAGKTGTADGARDIWFVGFTPDMVTAVWGGNDQDQPIAGNQVTGGTIMAGIWQRYMETYYAANNTPPGEFPIPEHPFIVEPEPLHFLPEPAGIFGNLSNMMPPLAPQRNGKAHHANRQDDSQKHKSGLGKLFKKLMKLF